MDDSCPRKLFSTKKCIAGKAPGCVSRRLIPISEPKEPDLFISRVFSLSAHGIPAAHRLRVRVFRSSSAAALFCCTLLFNGCYYLKQGARLINDQVKSRPIERLMRDPTLGSMERAFFLEIERIRAYAADSIGLDRNRNYTRFIKTDSSYLMVMLSAADPLSFRVKKWCYPFFGCYPLRSYYDRKDAERAGARLARRGYEICLDRVDGFSTLGIFSDPLYSFMADYPSYALANFIFHELTHATVYTRNVQFNEELANFVAREGALNYLKAYYGRESPEYTHALRWITDQETWLGLLRELYADLGNVYGENTGKMQKLRKKREIIGRFKRRLIDGYDSLFVTQMYRGSSRLTINNAFLAVRMTYNLDLELFARLYRMNGENLRATVEFAAEIKKRKGDPKKHLEKVVESEGPEK